MYYFNYTLLIFQIEAIKGNLNSQTTNFNNEIEKFGMRWDQLKPTEDQLEGDNANINKAIALIREKRQEWQILMETRDSLK